MCLFDVNFNNLGLIGLFFCKYSLFAIVIYFCLCYTLISKEAIMRIRAPQAQKLWRKSECNMKEL